MPGPHLLRAIPQGPGVPLGEGLPHDGDSLRIHRPCLSLHPQEIRTARQTAYVERLLGAAFGVGIDYCAHVRPSIS